MPSAEYDLRPVDSIRTGAIGPPGKRVFYLQGRKGDQLVTLIIEKTQVQSLAEGLEQFLDDLLERFPDLPTTEGVVSQSDMELERPIDPAFRVGQIGLGYDEDEDLMVLVARETPLNDIHLENLLKLSRMGVTILPPMPAFYNMPETLDDMVNHTVMRILDQFGISKDLARRCDGAMRKRTPGVRAIKANDS